MTPLNGRHEESRVDLDQVFRALSHTTRRRVLTSLMKDNPRGQQEFETMEFVPDGPEQETSTVRLRHTHLPHLDDAGFVDWDRESGTVTRGEHFQDLRPLLELMDDHREELPDGWP